mmetsp:Transcript_63248/g.131595  ORF Transcript_63248/g.131595 Transcript_63248/m.131595 type:complete len:142 (+) Transcript_63248:20-445(+)|eukprot:CAMPEP_0181295622 /NCGR_PEP_ID=MMETSP1101-20121128/4249_1 /TAXON_ID=46948 /ORGANISM="Rhodomonas abbreviata, Strain Caron Lab Isolate" /LENGTH=141 /DNA_ID=CAMNT_0023400393 /DNA_START=20 /DNA_END=445 /DNA_ORIENTATION=+
MAPKKAAAASKATLAGKKTGKSKVRTSTHFVRPRTLRTARKGKYATSVRDPKISSMDKFSIVRYPLTTESAMRNIEEFNTLVFIVDRRATKRQIKSAVSELYDLKTEKINTLIRPDGSKKAYCKLTPDFDALDSANRIGII